MNLKIINTKTYETNDGERIILKFDILFQPKNSSKKYLFSIVDIYVFIVGYVAPTYYYLYEVEGKVHKIRYEKRRDHYQHFKEKLIKHPKVKLRYLFHEQKITKRLIKTEEL